MDYNLLDALELLEREKGVPAETILDALANALVSAYKRTPGAAEEARVTIDADTVISPVSTGTKLCFAPLDKRYTRVRRCWILRSVIKDSRLRQVQ